MAPCTKQIKRSRRWICRKCLFFREAVGVCKKCTEHKIPKIQGKNSGENNFRCDAHGQLGELFRHVYIYTI